MKKLLVLAVLAVALIATPAMAKEGVYIGVGLGYNDIVGSDADFFDAASGLNLRIGNNFGSIALEGNFISSDHKNSGVGADADLRGFNVDLRVSFSQSQDPTQVYFLAGLGFYTLDFSNGNDASGSGFNLGVGFEHFFNEQVALNLGAVYRFITYDEVTISGVTYSASDNGDTLSLNAGLNLYF